MRTIFKFALEPEKCNEAIVVMFKKALDAASGIEQVERTLMDRLFWSHRPVIASVQYTEEPVKALLERLNAVGEKTVPKAYEYLKCFDEYVEFLNLDVDEYMHDLCKGDHDDDDHEEEVDPVEANTIDLQKLWDAAKKHRLEAEKVMDAVGFGVVGRERKIAWKGWGSGGGGQNKEGSKGKTV